MILSRCMSLTIAFMFIFFASCAQNKQQENGIVNKAQEIDVTTQPEYNFDLFKETIWRTKVKVALAAIKSYRGEKQIVILAPQNFDKKHPEYHAPPALINLICELPIGSEIRVERLMKDTGNWGGVSVTVTVLGGIPQELGNSQSVYLTSYLLEKNRFAWPAWSKSTDWAGAPELLEKVK